MNRSTRSRWYRKRSIAPADEFRTVARPSRTSPFHLPAGEAHITASIGIAFNRGGDSGPGDILREADIALYHAKANGKARYSVFDPHTPQAA